MPTLGYYLLLAAFVVCAYAAAMSVAGARRRSTALIESGVGAFYLLAAIMAAASSIIVYAFVVGDYSIKYVQRYSDSVQPLFFKLTAYWGGLDGSIMFWVTLLSFFGSVAIFVNRERHRELIPYVVAVIAIVEAFFLYLMIVHNNPFETFLTETPADGTGLNPLLQNFYMVIHPPTMYLGFVGLTIPYAFGMAALITGYLDDSWLRAVRRWTMISWLFLSVGLGLGMIWAYEELGWGGYWGWDPVENAGLLPWFTATAFLHSVMVQERRGMLRVWNVALVITTFFLTIFGTFMTRSGVVQSVHAFGDDPELAKLFTIFMITIVVVSFGFVIYRLPLLRARNELDSWVSREAAFLVNNWILLFCAVFVLFATMFPTLSEAVTGQRITVGPPFFNRWMAPIGMILLFLTGTGPLLAWRKSTLLNLRDQFVFPVLCATGAAALVTALGVRIWSSGICFALSGYVLGTISQEFWRGARVRQKATGTDLFTALVGLVGRNKRRYGGYIIHVAIVLMFLGFAGEGFKQEETVLLKPGQEVTVGAFTARLDALKVTDDGRKQMVTGHMTIFKNGAEFTKMYPARWFFRKHEDAPTTEVAIQRSFAQDVYIVMPAFDAKEQSASINVVVNPLVNWVWFGFGMLALGTLLALMPESTLAFATAKVTDSAGAVTAALLLLALLLEPTVAHAQHVSTGQVVPAARTPIEREVGRAIVCMCGTCGRKLVGECDCGYAAQMRDEISLLLKQGKTKPQVLQHFVEKYGSQEPLAEPIDEGFNRLAWLAPYLIGGFGLLGLGITARRWTSPATATGVAGAESIDAALDARLDDELRDLD
jgi:cytochrome c-type biogenesis protein CcmF